MQSLMGKFRLAFLAQMNAIANAGINLNDVEAVEQNVLDLQHGVEQLQGTVAERRAAVANVNTRITAVKADIAKIGGEIDILLRANQENQALTLQSKLEGEQHLLETLNGELKLDTDALAAIENSYNETKAILTQRQARLQQLRETASITKEQTQTRKTVTMAHDTLAAVGSIDDVAAKIERNQAVESEHLNMALEDLRTSTGQDAALASARAALAARKAALMGADAGTAKVAAS